MEKFEAKTECGEDEKPPPAASPCPADKDEKEFIKIKIVAQDSNEVHFRVKCGTSMGKVMKNYAERTGVSLGLRFLFDGKRINKEDTPRSLKMEEGDEIEAFAEQMGG